MLIAAMVLFLVSPSLGADAVKTTKSFLGEKDTEISGYIDHKVSRRDTASSLVSNYAVTWDEIRKANPGLKTTDIREGQIVKIPVYKRAATIIKEEGEKTRGDISDRIDSAKREIIGAKPKPEEGFLLVFVILGAVGIVLIGVVLYFVIHIRRKSDTSDSKLDSINSKLSELDDKVENTIQVIYQKNVYRLELNRVGGQLESIFRKADGNFLIYANTRSAKKSIQSFLNRNDERAAEAVQLARAEKRLHFLRMVDPKIDEPKEKE